MAAVKLAALVLVALLGCVAHTSQASYGYPNPLPPTPSPPPPAAPAPAALTVGYYHKTCHNAEKIVREVVEDAQKADPGIGAALIRLFFHDCFVRGCDASVLLDNTTANPQPEKLGIPNFPSLRGYEVIDAAKEKLEKECEGVVSCADIVAFAGRDATALLISGKKKFSFLDFLWGGWKSGFDMPAGRYDGNVSLAGETLPNLPPPFANVSVLEDMFRVKGLSLEDMVTLSGAHTVGISHCSSFRDRLPPNPSSMDPTLAASLQGQCSRGGDPTVVQDLETPDDLDNQYYDNVQKRNVLFKSDAALMSSETTSRLVDGHAKDRQEWLKQFKAAMVKMGSIEVKTEANGQIRKHCRFVN
ncbi:Peroxidase 2 [Triticum urartu]|uniref:Peroxidase n=2 Tax=Triticum TaxID=4564 RepID=M8AEA1_TRIUA|nr:peroxidase 2-like [Triticum urartu]EMS58939.1 Peroxidase 2 [Triticum urartu]